MSARMFACVCLLALTLSGCEEPLEASPQVQLSQVIPTVATVRWDPVHDDARQAFVEYGLGQAFDRRAPVTDLEAGVREAMVLGMKADEVYQFRAVEQVADVRYVSDTGTIRTGAAPTYLPRIEAHSAPGSQMAHGFAVGSIVSIPCTAVIVDGDGDYVWWHRVRSEADHVFIPRVRRSRVGEWVIFLAEEQDVAQNGPNHTVGVRVARIGLDGAPLLSHSLPAAHHDFAELPDGTIAVLEHDDRTVDGKHVRGDRIVEVRPAGAKKVIWSAWDHLEWDPDVVYGEPGTGWTHANALDYDHERDVYHVSLRNLDAILEIDRATGDVLWQLGGEGNDFGGDAAHDPLFQRQHQFEFIDGGVLVFDNGLVSESHSQVIEIALDTGAWTADLASTYESDPSLYSMVLGDVARLPNGNDLVAWSTAGVVEEATPDGEVVWKLQTQLGGGIGYVTWRRTLYSRGAGEEE